MKVINKKLNNKKGASILLALMLFFVCFMVASVILSSATANADKIRGREDIQKEYLSVSSAANLLRDAIGGAKYTGWEKETIYYCKSERNTIYPEKHDDVQEVCKNLKYDAGLAEVIRADLHKLVYEAYLSHTQYVPKTKVPEVLETEFEITGKGVLPVKVKVSLDTKGTEKYSITCLLTVKDSSNAMTVTFQAADSIDYEQTIEHGDRHWVWINDPDGSDGKWIEKSYDVMVKTLTTNITYDAGIIKKGVNP